ncbi:MAG: YdcF family protein [Candidatus Omnitrophica bacterium]|nr:YdcF family protein [Candidatus Omnitrophota bacterium]
MKILRRVFLIITFLMVVDSSIASVWFMNVISEEKTMSLRKADVGVILMGDINRDFTDVGPKTYQRLDYALKIHQQGLFKFFLCVGGDRPKHHFLGAEKMKDYLVKKGIKEENIFLEPHSYDTKTNLQYMVPILRENKWISVILISSPLHIHRIKKKNMIKCVPDLKVQWTPHPYFESDTPINMINVWKDSHYEWISYLVDVLPEPMYLRLVHFVRGQK